MNSSQSTEPAHRVVHQVPCGLERRSNDATRNYGRFKVLLKHCFVRCSGRNRHHGTPGSTVLIMHHKTFPFRLNLTVLIVCTCVQSPVLAPQLASVVPNVVPYRYCPHRSS